MQYFQPLSTTLAVLAVITDGVVLLLIAAMLATRTSERGRRRWSAFRSSLVPFAPALAWIAATIAMLGSLYLSEIAHLTPCRLCWYQRIAMYPLVVLLAIAVVRSDLRTSRRYMVPVALIGAVIAAYHYQLERFPNQPTLSCGLETPCSVPALNIWHFASVPFMALAAFLFIATVLLIASPAHALPVARQGTEGTFASD